MEWEAEREDKEKGLFRRERRQHEKRRRQMIFAAVLAVFFLGELFKGTPWVDQMSHALVVAFFGARTFFRAF